MGEIYSQDWSEFVKEDNIIPSVEESICNDEEFVTSFSINYSLLDKHQSSLNIY